MHNRENGMGSRVTVMRPKTRAGPGKRWKVVCLDVAHMGKPTGKDEGYVVGELYEGMVALKYALILFDLLWEGPQFFPVLLLHGSYRRRQSYANFVKASVYLSCHATKAPGVPAVSYPREANIHTKRIAEVFQRHLVNGEAQIPCALQELDYREASQSQGYALVEAAEMHAILVSPMVLGGAEVEIDETLLNIVANNLFNALNFCYEEKMIVWKIKNDLYYRRRNKNDGP